MNFAIIGLLVICLSFVSMCIGHVVQRVGRKEALQICFRAMFATTVCLFAVVGVLWEIKNAELIGTRRIISAVLLICIISSLLSVVIARRS